MSLIDLTYFIGENAIPNTDNSSIAERVNWFITKYEPIFLRNALGFPLYNALMNGMNVTAPALPAQRFLNILYGTQYTDFMGYLQQWDGLIVTQNPVLNITGGYVYKKPEYLIAGATPGLVPGTNTFTFDGTNNTDNWIGWTPIITRVAPMIPGIDYSYNPLTGILVLLAPGDKFGAGETFAVQFQLNSNSTFSTSNVGQNESMIANFIYWYFMKDGVSQSTGFGEVMANAENAVRQSFRRKASDHWNGMSDKVRHLMAYLEVSNAPTQSPLYPEWTTIDEHHALRYFGFINPFF